MIPPALKEARGSCKVKGGDLDSKTFPPAVWMEAVDGCRAVFAASL